MSFAVELPIIYLITTGEAVDADFPDTQSKILRLAEQAVDEEISLIQIREKNLSARFLFELTMAVVSLTRHSGTRILVNDRADIAAAAGADGVHLAASSLPVDVIRKNFGNKLIIGASTHSLADARAAAALGADFAVFGPVFETPGKGKVAGLGQLSEVCRQLEPFPIIGLGGIDASTCESVISAGASGVAAIRALNDPGSMNQISRILRV